MTTVRDLDLLPYREKTLHWMRADAWNPDGARLYFKQPKRAFRALMQNGNIIHSPLLVERPCYGIVTALLRYKDAMKPVRGRGLLPASRCASCILRESCERVVRERVKADPPLAAAHDEWLRAEGPSKFGIANFDQTHVGRLWKRLGLAAADAGFTSCNDQAVADHYERADREALLRDRLRQAEKRKKGRANGVIDAEHLSDLDVAADSRVIDTLEAINDPRAPRSLRMLPMQSLQDLRDVWLGYEVLKAERKKTRAPDIARWLEANDYRNESATFAAFCTRVSKDLNRIRELQRFSWEGRSLFRPFGPAGESWSQLWMDLANTNLLENADAFNELIPLGLGKLVRAELMKRSPQSSVEN